jgi:hypothetical protein
MSYEQQKKDFEALLSQQKRDFVKYREMNERRYNGATTIEQKAKIHAELEARREVFEKTQQTMRQDFEAGYAAELEAQELVQKSEKAVEREKMAKKLLPDYEEREKAPDIDALQELEEIKRKEALIREQNRSRGKGRSI